MSTSLSEKVVRILNTEHADAVPGPHEACDTYPAHPRDDFLTPFELDCRDWGLVYGITYGIARAEDPFEPEHRVAARALEAARDAFTRWGGDDIFTHHAYDKDRAARPVPVEA